MLSGNDPPSLLYRTSSQGRAVRHPDFDYDTDADIHLVICAKAGQPFADRTLAKEVCASVEVSTTRFGYRLYGYCLMPDHLHVLLSPARSGKSLKGWLQAFKSYTAHWAKKHSGITGLWQRSCYDHVCREGETAEKVLAYILSNPVSAGLAQRPNDWEWSKAFIEL